MGGNLDQGHAARYRPIATRAEFTNRMRGFALENTHDDAGVQPRSEATSLVERPGFRTQTLEKARIFEIIAGLWCITCLPTVRVPP
ncbi:MULTISPECIES: hypothetical protein [unclassified Novosphingobium]|uniref:hypothetical protein n=1 Tax=unclassified Novosphingobium TaxID=2644732 RepID=UPI00146A2BE3|nr:MULTISPECIES: hypothetical protein [unclassified Novosphingobium]NMN88944.1 hypothetical protein [Novosphingobium sp. SG916]